MGRELLLEEGRGKVGWCFEKDGVEVGEPIGKVIH